MKMDLLRKNITLCAIVSMGFLFFTLQAQDVEDEELETEEVLDLETAEDETEEVEELENDEEEAEGEEDVVEESEEEVVSEDSEEDAEEIDEEVAEEFEDEPEVFGADTEEFSEEVIGIQGNWVKKKKWLKEAHAKNDEIQEVALEVHKAVGDFYEKFKTIDALQDDFYKESGLNRGGIEPLFKDIEKYLEKNKKGDLKALADGYRVVLQGKTKKVDIYAIEEEFKKFKGLLEQLKLDIKSIEELDNSVGKRREKLQEQIRMVSDDSDKARKVVDEIWHIIDDRKAEEKFYELRGICEKISALKKFVTTDFISDFDSIIQKIKDQIAKTKNSIQDLEKKGIIIENRTERLEQLIRLKAQRKEEEDEEKRIIEEKKANRKALKEELAKEGWLYKVYYSITESVSDSLQNVKGYFSKKARPKLNEGDKA
jgi:hypothetical protein